MKIGVMGAKGSFSEEAARTYAKKHAKLRKFELLYLITAENVLASLENGAIDMAIFPIENSNGGIVLEAVHAMAKHNFHIKKMFEIDVHHCLLVKNGVTADKITTIVSHDQAIKQCRMYLRRVWPKVKLREYADTAKAAEDLANGKLPKTTAVIASRLAGELYKLGILEESIQDLKFNYTTFVAAEPFRK
jgi:prephenate dehydratase